MLLQGLASPSATSARGSTSWFLPNGPAGNPFPPYTFAFTIDDRA